MLHIIELKSVPILKQLELEEALLRTDTRNWCLINQDSPPSIVMGISQDPNLVVDFEKLRAAAPIPLIRRYSGGGTVVIEPTTVLVTLILNHDQIPVAPFPKEVLKWTEAVYQPAFPVPFTLKENDYAIGEKKCGGNAQYFAKKRFVHHTSFVWDYSHEYMNLLKIPPKMPTYRKNRSHRDFLEPLKNHFSHLEDLCHSLKSAILKVFPYQVSLDWVSNLSIPHRKTSCALTTQQILQEELKDQMIEYIP